MYTDAVFRRSYERSIDLLRGLVARPEHNSIGFFATSVDKDNYKRIFARDAFWILMAGILSEDGELLSGARDSIRTLAAFQRADGAIPSNVSPEGKVSYGVINPRVDPTTLFVIGCVRFAKRYPDEGIYEKYAANIKKAFSYLEENWENREYGLLYIPRAGNWADEYLQQGFVLYDEVLWYLAMREYADFLEAEERGAAGEYRSRAGRIRDTIRDAFWIHGLDVKDPLYERLGRKFDFNKAGYYIHFYHIPERDRASFKHPCAIFDAFGNILALLAGIVPPEHAEKVLRFIEDVSVNKYPLIPAHYPFFPEETFRTFRLHQYRFKQYVGHFHNGGLWAWYTGLFVAAMRKEGRDDLALKFLKGLVRANGEKRDGMDFFEYHTGKRAIAYLKVVRPEGMDFHLSRLIADRVKSARSMVLVHSGRGSADAESDMMIRTLDIKCGDSVKFTAVGPDAEEALRGIEKLAGGEDKFFEFYDIILKGSKPGGAPYLGVSAASFIIAYEAVSRDRMIFQ